MKIVKILTTTFLLLIGATFRAYPCNSFNVTQSINNFSWKIFEKLEKDKNSVISPYSIYMAFAPVYEGAAKETEKEIKNTFFYPSKTTLRKLLRNELLEKFKSKTTKISNFLLLDDTYPVKKNYLNTVEKYYFAKLLRVNFKTEEGRKKAVKLLNTLVRKETEGKIEKLLTPQSLTPRTKLIVANTIYFKDKWKIPFKKTKNLPFYTGEGKITVPTMVTTGNFEVYRSNLLKAVRLKYKNGFSLNIYIPYKKITQETLGKIQFKKEKVKLFLPKFKIKEGTNLKKTLIELGLKNPFTMEADFSNIDGTKKLYIEKAIHKAFVEVNEEGTEAAGATAVIIGLKSLPPRTEKEFKVDRPFIFTITDKKGTILFIGRVKNPSK